MSYSSTFYVLESINSFEGLIIPDGITHLYCNRRKITSFKGLILPDSLTKFDCSWCEIKSFKGLVLPPNLKYFNCEFNDITSFEGLILPKSLLSFYCGGNEIESLQGLVLPSSLTNFGCSHNQIKSFDGYIFPESIVGIKCDPLPYSHGYTIKQINEDNFIWRLKKGIDKINIVIKDKNVRDIQKLWKDYWYKPIETNSYDYPVSRYMISHYKELMS